RGAVDVSEYAQLAQVLRRYHRRPTLIEGTGIGDPPHFSATGHQRGGIIQALQKGGLVFPKGAEGPPWYKRAYDFFGRWGTGGPYFTHLHKRQEDAFEQWVRAHHVPFNVNAGISD